MTYKVTINTHNDHVLYADKIVNVVTCKEFDNITDAVRDINGGICMLLDYCEIKFEIENKGSIRMDDLDCDRHSIRAIYSHLSYLGGIGCSIDTYIRLTNFVQSICYDNNEDMITILTSLSYIHER